MYLPLGLQTARVRIPFSAWPVSVPNSEKSIVLQILAFWATSSAPAVTIIELSGLHSAYSGNECVAGICLTCPLLTFTIFTVPYLLADMMEAPSGLQATEPLPFFGSCSCQPPPT